MNLKIIGVLSTFVLLNTACSKEENMPPSYTNTSAISSSTAVIGSASATSTADTSGNAGSTDPAARELLNTHWKLIVLNNSDIPVTEKEREPYIVFDGEKRVSGSDGCNRLTGSYTQENDQLKFNEIVTTRMACADSGEQAAAIHKVLENVSRYTIHADQLELRDDTGLVLARLQAVTQPRY